MRSFLKYTLATIVGLIIVIIMTIIILGGVVAAIVSSTDTKEIVIKDNSVLAINFDEAIVDRQPNDPFQSLDIPGLSGTKKLGLDKIITAIENAKDNENIKGIYLKVDEINAGYSACEEIRNALLDFKDSEKFIYAYSESYSQKGYFLTSLADKVFINPEGMIVFSGIASTNTFYKNALDKLGVEMQIIRHGKFKSAVEPFMLDKMSPENRRQIEVYIGSIWNNIVRGISESRNISISELNRIADENMTYRPANTLLSYRLVDSVVYEDQVLDVMREKIGIKQNEKINFISLHDVKPTVVKNEGKTFTKNKLAVIYASGEISMTPGTSLTEESISGPEMAEVIREARMDTTIKAIVLRINSPGGSSVASELIWREVDLATKQKPVVVSMGDLAASGGYYIACAADTIIANPTTLTGSIGVFGVIPNFQNLLSKKLGINTEVVKTNEKSDLPSVTRPLNDKEREIMQGMVENVYTTFVNHVSEGRGLPYQQVDEIGQGRVWTGENALKLGLVDMLGNLNDAIEIAKEMGGLDHYRVIKLPVKKDPFEEIIKSFSTQMEYKILEKNLGEGMKYYRTLETLKNVNGIQARLPYEFEVN